MIAELESYLDQILSVKQDAAGIAGVLTDEQFNWRPSAEQWSVGQCIEHLSITTEKYLPVLDAAIERARASGLLSGGPFAYGWFGRWFTKNMEPPVRRRFKTPAAFQAGPALPKGATMNRFADLQDAFAARIRNADGVDLRRVKVRSQFGPLSFSLGQTFALLLAHERRHVWQARQVASLIDVRV